MLNNIYSRLSEVQGHLCSMLFSSRSFVVCSSRFSKGQGHFEMLLIQVWDTHSVHVNMKRDIFKDTFD